MPNDLAQSFRQLGRIDPAVILTTHSAVLHYESSGGQLTHLNSEVTFGADPLCGYPHLQSFRERDFLQVYLCLDEIFQDVQHGNGILLKQAFFLLTLIATLKDCLNRFQNSQCTLFRLLFLTVSRPYISLLSLSFCHSLSLCLSLCIVIVDDSLTIVIIRIKNG